MELKDDTTVRWFIIVAQETDENSVLKYFVSKTTKMTLNNVKPIHNFYG